MIAGCPDWNAATAFDGQPAYAAWQRPGEFAVPPTALVARTHDGAPALALDLYRQDRHAAGLAEFSLLSLAFSVQTPLPELRETRASEGFVFQPMRAERGWIRLDPVGALDLPEAVRALQPLDVAGGASLALGVRLDALATEMFLGALRRGMALINADAWYLVRGVAARCALTLSVDPPALLAGVRAAAAASGAVEGADSRGNVAIGLDTLRAALLADSAAFGLARLRDVPERERPQAVQAVLDRCVARFAEPQPAATDGGVALAFDPARMGPAQLRWDLDEVLLAPRIFALSADPLGPLRELDVATLEREAVREHVAPALDSGWHAIAVHANVPARRVGLLRTQIELIAPPVPPARPFATRASLPLPADGVPGIATLRLGPAEPLSYRWRTQAFVADAGRVVALTGPERNSDRELLVIAPADFGVNLVGIDAEPSFLAEATIALEAKGTRQGRPWSLTARLDRDAPAVAFAVPADVADGTLVATALAREGDARAAMTPVALQPTTLDAFSFEGSGARALDARCDFDDARAQVLLEVVPEGREHQAERVRLLRLTPAVPQERWTWAALSPLRPGYRWRWFGTREWSAATSPASPLAVRSSEAPATA